MAQDEIDLPPSFEGLEEMGSLTEVLEQAQTAVYVEKWQRILCGNCFHLRSEHAGDKCLFEPTTFKMIPDEVLRRIARKKFTRNKDMIEHIKYELKREEDNVLNQCINTVGG